MPLEQLAPRLRRWTAWHEEWKQDVGSLAVATGDGSVLIDPLDPPPLLPRPEHVLITIFWHARSTSALGAEHVWAPAGAAQRLRNRGVEVTDAVRGGDRLPGGIEVFETARSGEAVYWLPEQRALAAGDVLLGATSKPRPIDVPLRLCPAAWLGDASLDDLRDSLRPLLDLPVERVLVSHGDPVLADGRAALEAALA
jgi:glyoxylase-like metal-dependent hydrolase (beta-lactamase superfamily II)